MTLQDRRHGTNRGYIIGCRNECCTRAHTVYMKLYRMGRRNRLISPLGTIRRIEALQCLGWTMQEVGALCGFGSEWVYNLRRSDRVTARTAATLARVYDELSMRLPPERTQREKAAATKSRRRAALHGWAPPLAWTNIDDPDEQPRGLRSEARSRYDLDPVVVERVLAGDRDQPVTRAERHEVIRRWPGSIGALERLRPDWNVARDLREMRAGMAS